MEPEENPVFNSGLKLILVWGFFWISGLKGDVYFSEAISAGESHLPQIWGDKLCCLLPLKANNQSHSGWRRLRTKTQHCWTWSKDGNPGAQAPTAATNYQLAASQLLLMNLLCFVSLAKNLLEQGREAVPIFLSYFISSGAFGMGGQLTPAELLDQTLSKSLSQAEELSRATLGKTGNNFTWRFFPAGQSTL